MSAVHKTPSEDEIASTLSHLELSSKVPQKPAQKPKSKPVADSWDEELSGSDTETEEPPTTLSTVTSNDLSPHPPPPTPASPSNLGYPDSVPFGRSREDSGADRGGSGGSDKRPEKTTAVAGRLIAGALGIRPPKRTDEEREYDRVMREKQRKKRDEEKQKEMREKEEADARKKAVWDD